MTRSILVIEDDKAIRRGLTDALTATGYRVYEAANGHDGLASATTLAVDLIVLDVMLPGVDGFEVLAGIRRQHAHLPVIMLTARGTEGDRVNGLRHGADDYVVKPFSVKELLARIEAVLRRSRHSPKRLGALQWRGLCIDLERRAVTGHAVPAATAELTQNECDFLAKLAFVDGRAVSREELLDDVWGVELSGAETRTVDMLVTRLREKLRTAFGQEAVELVQTVRGSGYRLAADAMHEAVST